MLSPEIGIDELYPVAFGDNSAFIFMGIDKLTVMLHNQVGVSFFEMSY